MKRTAFWYSILGCLSMIIMMTSCKKSSDYARVIPADAEVVCRVQAAQLLDKCGIDNGKFLKEKLLSVINKQATPELSEKLAVIVEDPAKSGLDFKSPVYLAVGGEVMGTGAMVVARVNDQDALTELLQTIATDASEKVMTEGNLTCLSLDGLLMASDGTTLVMMERAGAGSDAMDKVKSIMNAESEKSILDDEGFKKMNACKGDMQLLGNAGYMEELLKDEMQMLTSVYPSGIDAKDMAGLVDVNFANGEIALSMEVVAKTDEARQYLESVNQLAGKIGNSYFSRIPEKSLFVMALNVKGEKFWEQLKATGSMDVMPDEAKAILEKALTNLDGDVVMAMQADPMMLAMNPGEATVTVYAKVKDGSKVEQMMTDMGMGDLTKNADGIYALPVQQGMVKYLYLKVEGNDMLMSNKIDMVRNEKVADPVDADMFKGKSVAFVLNVKPITENPAVEAMAKAAGARPTVWTLASQFDRMEIFSKESTKAECHIYLKDKKQNALAFFVNIGLQLSDEMI